MSSSVYQRPGIPGIEPFGRRAVDNGQGLRGIKNVDPEARVIIVSALDQRAVLKEAFKACASDFLVKPFDREVLLNTLNQLVA